MTDEELLASLDKFVTPRLTPEEITKNMSDIRAKARDLMEGIVKIFPAGTARDKALSYIQKALFSAIQSMLMPEMQFDQTEVP